MNDTSKLADLARWATEGKPFDAALTSVLAIVRDGVGATAVALVDGTENPYRLLGSGDFTNLTNAAVWRIQRDLTTATGPRVFSLRNCRVGSFRDAAPGAACHYLAALLPVSDRPAHMLLARGPWRHGLSGARKAFLAAAMPAIGHLVDRERAAAALQLEGQRLATLFQIAPEADMASTLRATAATVAAVAGVDYVVIELVDAANRFTLRVTNLDRHGHRPTLGADERVDDAVRSEVLRTGRSLMFTDVKSDDGMPAEVATYLTAVHVRSLAMLPLATPERVIGLLGLGSHRQRDFDCDDRGLLERLADYVGTLVRGLQDREALLRTEGRLRTVAANTPIVLFALDGDGMLTLAEGRGLESRGVRPGQFVGRSIFDVLGGSPEIIKGVRRALAGEAVTDVFELAGRVYETYLSPLSGVDGGIAEVIGVATDITERAQATAALIDQARRDPLTGVFNRTRVFEQLQAIASEADSSSSFAIALVDVDSLKAVNDTYGHQLGDEMLTHVAQALARGDAAVGRYGGDEFFVILPSADGAAAALYRDEVLTELASVRLTDQETGATVPVAASIGVAVYPDEADTTVELVRLADAAMYAAKRTREQSGTGLSSGRANERSSALVGELLPLLTSPATLEEKLRLVSHRLSVGGGYEVVHFETYTASGAPPAATNTFARLPDEVLARWNEEQRGLTRRPLEELLVRTRRAVILDDPQNDMRLTEGERTIIRAAGLRSAVTVPMLWQEELVGSLNVASKQPDAFTAADVQFLTGVANQVTAVMRMATLVDDLQAASSRLAQSQTEAVILLAAAAEAHDATTGAHLQRVRTLTRALARELGYDDVRAEELGKAAVLHDIGKIRVPDAILISPAQLSDVEWALMKQHTVWGAEFLTARPGFELAATVARSHHERWDGTGYPAGLKGEEIPLAAAIVSVADALDAMTNDRPYRERRTARWAIAEIEAGAGQQFSPRVVEALGELFTRGGLPFADGPAEDLLDVA